jgi:hypothetical protein
MVASWMWSSVCAAQHHAYMPVFTSTKPVFLQVYCTFLTLQPCIAVFQHTFTMHCYWTSVCCAC